MRSWGVVMVVLLWGTVMAKGQVTEPEPLLHLDGDNGLRQQTVTSLAQDEFGRIWIGTRNGLQYWDGDRLYDLPSISTAVHALHQKDSFLFCVSIHAAHRIHTRTGSVISYPLPEPDYAQTAFFGTSLVVVGSYSKDTIWLNTDLEQIAPEMPPDELSQRLQPDPVPIADQQLQLHDFQRVTLGTDTLPGIEGYVPMMTSYNRNRVFMATQMGLIDFRSSEGNFRKRTLLEGKRIECLLVDVNHNLWVGTADEGLLLYHRRALQSTYYQLGDSEGKPGNCWGFMETQDALYTATSSGMVNLDRTGTDEIEELTRGMFCFSGFAGDGFTLIGSAVDGIYRIRDGKIIRAYWSSEEVLNNIILQFLANDQGVLAITKRGFVQLDHQGNFLFHKPYYTHDDSWYAMSIVREGTGYLAATTVGMMWFDADLNATQTVGVASARVFASTIRFRDTTWVTSMDGGLYYLRENELNPVATDRGDLLGIGEINQQLWFNSFGGVYRLRGKEPIPHLRENGFPLPEYNQGGFHVDQNGALCLGGVGGVFRFRPEPEPAALALPNWFVEVDGAHQPDGITLQLNSDQSQVSLQPRSIQHTDQNRFVLEVQQQGEWRPFENYQPLVATLGYGPGQVAFRVTNRVTGESRVHTLNFYRQLPFWQSWWFIGLMILSGLLALIGLVFLWQYLRTRRLLREESEARKVSQERLRISRELHDNIGARLSHIISSLDIELYKNKDQSGKLDRINEFARETMTQLRETIWAVADKTIYFSELISRVEHYVKQANELSEAELEVHAEVDQDHELNAVQVINYYRIVQEAINNAIKYSGGTEVNVEVYRRGNLQHLRIVDNGSGFDSDNPPAGSGLVGMADRAREAGGQCAISSSPEGTIIHIRFTVEG